MIDTAADLIEALGGPTRVGRMLRASRQAVHNAGKRGILPGHWRLILARRARSRKLQVNPALFEDSPYAKVHRDGSSDEARNSEGRGRGAGQTVGCPARFRKAGWG